jgi:DNA processing protein
MLGVGPGGPVGPAVSVGSRGEETQPPAAPAGRAEPTVARAPAFAGGAVQRAAEVAAERLAWAVLVGVEGVGPVTLAALVEAFGTGRAVLEVAGGPRGPERVLAGVAATGRVLDRRVARALAEATEGAASFACRLAALGIAVVTVDDAAFPERLRLLEMPPPVLFVRGNVVALDALHPVAVVGTRRPTERGRRIATAIGAALATAGASVISGLALGIDGAAHAACIEAGGPTVAVLGGGHACLYPAAHEPLGERIVAHGGAVVSELAPDVPAVAGTFPRRNRVIAGLADATVVVEAGTRSGALITAGWALEQGRECFAVPGPIDCAQTAGCNGLLRLYPGQVRAVPGVPELIEDLGLADLVAAAGGAAGAAGARDPAAGIRRHLEAPTSRLAGQAGLEAILATLGPAERSVARAVAPRPATLDELVAATGYAPAVLLAVLTRLEDRGLVVPALGRYAAAGALAATPPAVLPG